MLFFLKKAPEHAYPEGLDDCFQVYQWILKHAHNVFSTRNFLKTKKKRNKMLMSNFFYPF